MKTSKLITMKFIFFLFFVMLVALPNKAEAASEAQRVVVALSGGDFTSINDALNSISPDENNPYVIDVMPGTYTENVTMKDYVHLRGAGAVVTTIQAQSQSNMTITIVNLTNVTISGVTITGGITGIRISASSPMIKENIIRDSGGFGIWNTSSSGTFLKNTISGHYGDGFYNHESSPKIIGNVIINNSGNGIVETNESSSIIKNNIIEGNGSGIFITYSSPSIIHNKITNNSKHGNQWWYDIVADYFSNPNISFNIYDKIDYSYGAGGAGLYNVKSDGTPAPNP